MELPFAVSDPEPALSPLQLESNSSTNGLGSVDPFSVNSSAVTHESGVHSPRSGVTITVQNNNLQGINTNNGSIRAGNVSNGSAGANFGNVGGGGGLLYNNLIPGHYRYGACPPAPPPGPLSYSNSSPRQNNNNQYTNTNNHGNSLNPNQSSGRYENRSGRNYYNNAQLQQQQQHSQQQLTHLQRHYHSQSTATSRVTENSNFATLGSTAGARINSEDDFCLQVVEPDDDDDLLLIASPDIGDGQDDDDGNDEKYYRPLQHHSSGISTSTTVSSGINNSVTGHLGRKSANNGSIKQQNVEESILPLEQVKPIDVLSILLSGPANTLSSPHDGSLSGDEKQEERVDITVLMEEAACKSRRARNMTIALASRQLHQQHEQNHTKNRICSDTGNSSQDDNDVYISTANAHTDAAAAFRKVYRELLGHGFQSSNPTATNDAIKRKHPGTGTSSVVTSGIEIAKSMVILANNHARMAASLGAMGAKWNMGKVDSSGRMIPKNSSSTSTSGDVTNANTSSGSLPITSKSNRSNNAGSSTPQTPASSSQGAVTNATGMPQHERLRMAVRGALDMDNHEEDITNSTFLNRSTVLNASKSIGGVNRRNVGANASLKSSVGGGKTGGGNKTSGGEVNPVDDLMKLEKELRCIDMALEMGSSVASLGAAVASRPDGSFCVVPPGSSYMSSSSMWTSGIMGVAGGGGGGGGNPQQTHQHHATQKGMTAVRSRKNLVQNFLGGNNGVVGNNGHGLPTPGVPNVQNPQQATTPTQLPAKIAASQPRKENNAALEASWWGGGAGSMMSSVLASTAINTAVASSQRHPQSSSGPPTSHHRESANTKQLMQLMDSLNRLGNENAQLMRELEEAKAARAEAKAAKEMIEKFKTEYAQRFTKVKEALEKYPKQHGTGAADNPVMTSEYLKSATTAELQKRDQMIKNLAAELRKEREESKKKDAALRKYEGFYREVKARSAEKKLLQKKMQQEQQNMQK